MAKTMFDDMAQAIEWAKQNYPNCSFSVKQQEDGPTIVSVKHKETKELRTVVYVRKGHAKTEKG